MRLSRSLGKFNRAQEERRTRRPTRKPRQRKNDESGAPKRRRSELSFGKRSRELSRIIMRFTRLPMAGERHVGQRLRFQSFVFTQRCAIKPSIIFLAHVAASANHRRVAQSVINFRGHLRWRPRQHSVHLNAGPSLTMRGRRLSATKQEAGRTSTAISKAVQRASWHPNRLAIDGLALA